MGRRGSGGSNTRRQPTVTASMVQERIKSCKISHLSYKDIADKLREHYPDYRHFKLIPFRNKIQQILLPHNHINNNNNNSSRKRLGSGTDTAFFKDIEEGEGRSPVRKKRRQDKDDEEGRLAEKEEDHFRRRADGFGTGTTSSVSSGAASTSSDEDAIYSEEAEPVFDLMNSQLRAKYSDTSLTPKSKQTPKLKSKIEGGDEERNVEVEDVRREKKLAGGAATLGVGGGEKGGSEVVEEGEVKGKGKEGVRFKDFGGIKEVIDELIMEVIVPLYHPELPQWLGVKPMSGILLHGPPGCGKTRLAQAIANETDVPFYQISATEVVSGVSGASEENIRELFSKAYQTAPSIVFIDEIDAIASKRENLQREMERRIVTQLLTCMDESHRMVKVNNNNNSDTELDDKKSGYVLVIGATNRPDAVDAALRRPGRFDREIALGVPDEKSRAEILSLLTQKMRVAGDFDLNKIAKATPGFVGADLVALANKAGNLAMKRSIDLRRLDLSTEEELEEVHAQDWWKKSWPPEEMKKLSITMTDFEVAAKSVQPSSRREGFSTIPDVKWEDVGGLHDLRRQFTLYVVNRIKYATLYEESGVDLETGFLLYGPPGCGKTLIAKAVANEAGANFIHVKGPELLTKYVGESESHVRRIFSRARTCAPCIIFFDEVDALTTERGKEGGWVVERLLNQLLIELNGGDHRRGVYVIGATNRPDVMDHALLRPGRFGKLLFVPLPTADERGLILKALARKKPVDASVNFIELGERCENMSGADLSALVNEAAMAALEERLESATTVFGDSSSNIKPVHFEKALSIVKPSVSEERKRHYEKLSLTFRTA